jgi:hypothetical protein
MINDSYCIKALMEKMLTYKYILEEKNYKKKSGKKKNKNKDTEKDRDTIFHLNKLKKADYEELEL